MQSNIKKPLPNLRAEMARCGFTNREIARGIGVSESAYSSWLRGDSAPSVFQAYAIASKFFDDLTIEYLFIE